MIPDVTGDGVDDFLMIHGTHESIVPGVDVPPGGGDISALSDPATANRKIISGKGRDDPSLALERPASFESRKVDLIDLNNDGLKELVLTGVDNQVVTLFASDPLGNGAIQYDTKDPTDGTAVEMVEPDVEFSHVLAGDVNNDGFEDLIMMSATQKMVVLNPAPATGGEEPDWTSAKSMLLPVDPADTDDTRQVDAEEVVESLMHDVDGDGLLDLVLVTASAIRIHINPNAPPDADGNRGATMEEEKVQAEWSAGTVHTLMLDELVPGGTGTIQKLLPVDFDQDGVANELLVGTTVSGTAVGELFVLDLLEATAPGALLSASIEELLPAAFGVDVTALRETDLNGDGATDIVVGLDAGATGSTIKVLYGKPAMHTDYAGDTGADLTSYFTIEDVRPPDAGGTNQDITKRIESLELVDMNNDGNEDLVWAYPDGKSNILLAEELPLPWDNDAAADHIQWFNDGFDQTDPDRWAKSDYPAAVTERCYQPVTCVPATGDGCDGRGGADAGTCEWGMNLPETPPLWRDHGYRTANDIVDHIEVQTITNGPATQTGLGTPDDGFGPAHYANCRNPKGTQHVVTTNIYIEFPVVDCTDEHGHPTTVDCILVEPIQEELNRVTNAPGSTMQSCMHFLRDAHRVIVDAPSPPPQVLRRRRRRRRARRRRARRRRRRRRLPLRRRRRRRRVRRRRRRRRLPRRRRRRRRRHRRRRRRRRLPRRPARRLPRRRRRRRLRRRRRRRARRRRRRRRRVRRRRRRRRPARRLRRRRRRRHRRPRRRRRRPRRPRRRRRVRLRPRRRRRVPRRRPLRRRRRRRRRLPRRRRRRRRRRPRRLPRRRPRRRRLLQSHQGKNPPLALPHPLPAPSTAHFRSSPSHYTHRWMDSGYYRAIMIWAWGLPIPDFKLPNGFSKALQENVTAAMNYTLTGGNDGDILWSHGHYSFDPLDPAQSGDNSIMPFLLLLTERTFADPADFQDEVDTIGRRRLTEAQIRRQLSEDEPRWTHHPIFVEPDFPHLDVSACNQPGWSYFLVWVEMETTNDMQRKEFWQVMEDERVSPVMAYPPPEQAGRRLEESFVAEACSEPEFVWSKRIHPAPSPPPPPPPPEGGIKEREYTVAGTSIALLGFAGVCVFGIFGQRWLRPRAPKCNAPAPGPIGPGFVVLGGGGGGLHDRYHEQDEVCPKRPGDLLYKEHRRVTFDKNV